MKRLLAVLLTLILSGQIFAFTSDHAIITPDNLAKFEDFKVWIYRTQDDPDMVNVVLPFHPGDKKYWLFSSFRELSDEELNFRSLIWLRHKPTPDFIDRIAPIAPLPGRDGKIHDDAFIEVKIRKDVLEKTYIYQDFPYGVDGGGWYFTYRLSAFPIGYRFDPIMSLEWDISRYKRTGDNPKHREAERKLRQLLADEVFMAEWRRRHKTEQGGADQPATCSESDSEGGDKPQPESEGRSR